MQNVQTQMLLFFASAVAWTMYFCLLRPRLPSLRSIDIYFDDGTVQQSRCINEVPVGDHIVAYGVKYVVDNKTYVAKSSVISWPLRLRARHITVDRAELRNGMSLDVTERIRRWSGANCDFHLDRNTLTWGDLIRHDEGTLSISFKRYRWYWPFSCTTETFTTGMDQPLINVKPYVT